MDEFCKTKLTRIRTKLEIKKSALGLYDFNEEEDKAKALTNRYQNDKELLEIREKIENLKQNKKNLSSSIQQIIDEINTLFSNLI